jgi:hypothetical protein
MQGAVLDASASHHAAITGIGHTLRTYVKTIEDLARYFKRPPDRLGPDQLRQYQAYLFGERKLAPNK